MDHSGLIHNGDYDRIKACSYDMVIGTVFHKYLIEKSGG